MIFAFPFSFESLNSNVPSPFDFFLTESLKFILQNSIFRPTLIVYSLFNFSLTFWHGLAELNTIDSGHI